uniref:growth-regulating factor 5-like n=1 Tax=Erigeron canadensis TaxID=72917 RepID=UPI001CB919D3|nr:growth-regulating factor 5-like [Erigeron canadensis]
MVSGVPVPTDLILSVRRSLFTSTFSTSSSSAALSNQHTLGVWEGSFQYNQLYGYGRKIDLEPGRCRRTDGKKWRCSKEAYPDSKYCERHMHRGRNRSRKPVEFSSSSSSTSVSSSSTTSSIPNVSSSLSTTISKSFDTYPQFSSNQTNFMDSSAYSYQTLKDYRYLQQGMKNFGEDERTGAYFHLNDPYTNHTLKISSDHHYSHFNFQNLKQQQNKEDDETQGRHCFVMGTDFVKSPEGVLVTKSSIRIDGKADETTSKQPFHHFFAPPKNTQENAWIEIDQQQNHHLINQPKPPLSTQDLFQSKPRPY